jgi:hypothetical protein
VCDKEPDQRVIGAAQQVAAIRCRYRAAKLSGSLLPERAYNVVVRTAKAVGLRA